MKRTPILWPIGTNIAALLANMQTSAIPLNVDGASWKKRASLAVLPMTTFLQRRRVPIWQARRSGNHPRSFHRLPAAIAPAPSPRKELSSIRLA